MRKLAIAAVLLAAALALASVGGCTSSSLPPPADSSLAAEPLGLTVGVEAHRVAPFSDELVRALRGTGLFAIVDRVDRLERPADVVATVERGWEGSAAIPIWTVLSLGLIPTIVDETHGLSFALHAPGAPIPRVELDARWTGRTWFGLASALRNASPNRTGGDPRRDPRYLPHVTAVVAAHAAEIRSLVGRR